MRMKVLILGLALTAIFILGLSTLASFELVKLEWEDDGTASAIILNASYNEVWEKVLDILLFEDFKLSNTVKPTHEAVTIEKDTGLIVIKGLISYSAKYTLKVTLRKRDCNIIVECRSDGAWRKKVVEKFFQSLGED